MYRSFLPGTLLLLYPGLGPASAELVLSKNYYFYHLHVLEIFYNRLICSVINI